MRLRLRWWLIAAGFVVLVVALRATACRPRPIEVEVATVGRGIVEDAVTNSQAGTVKARQRARVGAERAGRVAAIPRREGSHARRGETLLMLDASTAQMQLEAAKRDLEAAGAAAAVVRSAATWPAEKSAPPRCSSRADLAGRDGPVEFAARERRRRAQRATARDRRGVGGRLAQDELDPCGVRAFRRLGSPACEVGGRWCRPAGL